MKRIGVVFGLLVLIASCQKEVITPRTLSAERGETMKCTENATPNSSSLSASTTINNNGGATSGSAGISVESNTTVILDENGGITDPNHDPSGNNKDRRKR